MKTIAIAIALAVAPGGAALAGNMHEHGLAADLRGDPAALAWAHKHAAKYGLAFPRPWQPWHVEPLGARETLPRTMREAVIYCEQNDDAREADATGKHFLSVKACASRIMNWRKAVVK